MNTSVSEELRQWRRQFHQIPETGWSEFVTSATLIGILRGMGYQVLPGRAFLNTDTIPGRYQQDVDEGLARAKALGVAPELLAEMDGLTGCVALLDTGVAGPTTGMRFDIDCVSVDESRDSSHQPYVQGFMSRHPGCMHACGHDGHMATGLGIARWLMTHKSGLKGRFKLVFQPAEEGVRGARPVAEGGILDDVDYFFSAHLGMGCPTGEIIVNPQEFLCTTKLDFRFYGSPAHAGVSPQGGANALAGACHCVTQLLAIPRHGEGMTRINVGTLRAGEGRNVIPSGAWLQLEVRGGSPQINSYMVQRALNTGEGIARGFNLRFEHEVMGEATDLHNDMELVDLVSRVARDEVGLSLREGIFGGSEDATLLVRRVQEHGGKAIYFVLGSDICAGHHEASFDFDESSLLYGVQIFTGCISVLNRR
ncbi:amidohydrolase [Salmonella enterica subsp. enterica serovar Morehead]|nr:amidohydrolase [Salmonella enterica subsp. enterica serovar Kottbus]EEM2539471.1 amidohydrolase [Salmonella enterica subsp. enterica serovar Morehead]EHN5889117.1 amidohydrolase [Salmonella enterica subsp. enterica serovar Newport]